MEFIQTSAQTRAQIPANANMMMAAYLGRRAKLGRSQEDQENLPGTSEIIKALSEQQLTNPGEGKVLYIQGIKNNGNWRPMCYASQNFRAYYTLQLFNARVSLTKKAIEKAIEQEYVPQRFFKSVKTVLSLGCGPGSDLHGFKTFLSEAFPFSSRGKKSPQFIGYDRELGWMHYVQSLGFEFESVEINKTLINDMNKVDVMLISYSAKKLFRDFNREKNDETFWKAISKKAKFVLVIDDEKCLYDDLPTDDEDYEYFTWGNEQGETEAVVYCHFTAEG